MIPNAFCSVKTNVYKLPENKRVPAVSKPPAKFGRRANGHANKATAWIK
jgi:hypothetical protein